MKKKKGVHGIMKRREIGMFAADAPTPSEKKKIARSNSPLVR